MSSVALVVLDTLRKDAFDEHFEWLPGRRFENAYSTTHWTGPAHASLFTGLYPSEAGTYAQRRSFDYPGAALAERLRDDGYTTRAYSSNVIVSPEFGFDRGFEEFHGSWNVELALTDGAIYDWHTLLRERQDVRTYLRGFLGSVRRECETLPSLRRGLELLGGRRALDYGTRTALDTVRETEFGDREFLFVNLMEAHSPYYPPPAHRTVDGYETTDHPLHEATGDLDRERIRQAYDDCVRYLSTVYERIVAELAEDFDYVVTVGDHGELFGEHGFYEHTYGVFPELTHVPLVVSGVDVPDERREETVNLLDVHRTVLELAGLDPASDRRGRPLLGDVEARECLTEYGGVPHPRQVRALREHGVPSERIAAYHEPLYGVALPGNYYGYQTPDGFRERGTAPVDDPQRRLERLLADRAEPESAENESDLPDGVLDQLEQLGYAG